MPDSRASSNRADHRPASESGCIGSSASRRGGTLAGLLVTLSVVGALSVTAVVVAPRYLAADPPWRVHPEVVAARTAAHQELIDSLAALFGRSVAVLAIHQRGPTPFVEVVLWLQDDDESGQPDESELALLSHSEVMQTITIYRLGDDEEDPAAIPLDAHHLAGAAFCDRWRADRRVAPLVLMSGVSDMRVEPLGSPHEGSQRLRIVLTWASDSADGSDEASVLVDAAVHPDDTAE